MRPGVRIAGGAAAAILAHARAEAPNECCGLLVGRPGSIARAVPARNIADRPAARYLIDPQDYFEAIRTARASGCAVIGFYHSHPAGPPTPSPTDLAEAGDPEAIYVIAGTGAGGPLADIRAFRLANQAASRELALTVVEEREG